MDLEDDETEQAVEEEVFILEPFDALLDVGRQVREAEAKRNHIEPGKLGDAIDVLFGGLASLSKAAPP